MGIQVHNYIYIYIYTLIYACVCVLSASMSCVLFHISVYTKRLPTVFTMLVMSLSHIPEHVKSKARVGAFTSLRQLGPFLGKGCSE